MKIKHKVPADYISKPKLQEFIQQRVDEAVKPEDVRIESMALKMFGFLPPDYDLKKVLIELMTEQAAAFYDYDRKKLYITESDSSFLEKRAALVHELAHALADQNFSLGKYLRKGTKSDDAATARRGGHGGAGDLADVGVCLGVGRRRGGGAGGGVGIDDAERGGGGEFAVSGVREGSAVFAPVADLSVHGGVGVSECGGRSGWASRDSRKCTGGLRSARSRFCIRNCTWTGSGRCG